MLVPEGQVLCPVLDLEGQILVNITAVLWAYIAAGSIAYWCIISHSYQ